MRSCIIALCLIGFALFSCSDKDNTLPVPIPDENRLNLMELVPGQETMYIGYEQVCDSANFSWTGDTLVTRILEEGGQLYMSEQFTEGSPIYQYIDTVLTYPISSVSGVVTIPQRAQSALFNFYGSDKIHLEPSGRINLAQSGCLIATNDQIFQGDDIGRIDRFDFGPFTVKDKTAVSCVPVIDLDAYLIYDRHQLYLSHQVSTSSFMGQDNGSFVWGWKMVE